MTEEVILKCEESFWGGGRKKGKGAKYSSDLREKFPCEKLNTRVWIICNISLDVKFIPVRLSNGKKRSVGAFPAQKNNGNLHSTSTNERGKEGVVFMKMNAVK